MRDIYGLALTLLGMALYVHGLLKVRHFGGLRKIFNENRWRAFLWLFVFLLASILVFFSVESIFIYFFSTQWMPEFGYIIYPSLFLPVSFWFRKISFSVSQEFSLNGKKAGFDRRKLLRFLAFVVLIYVIQYVYLKLMFDFLVMQSN